MPEQCFDEVQGAPDFKGIVPRMSAVYDLFGDGKTAVKFSASRYDQPITLSNVQRVNPLGIVNDTRAWTVCAAGQTSGCDLNGDLTPQLNELGVSSGFPFGVNNRYSDGSGVADVERVQHRVPAPAARQRGRLGRLHPPRNAPEHRRQERRRSTRELHPARR